jgi:hypothetical protein
MAVGITILSGARQGDRIEFDLPEFRAGGGRGCQVFFDPDRDREARGCEALFRLDDDGWSLKNLGGGELLVNDRPVRGNTRMRSGDVVRLSPLGPDFSFHLLARLSAATTASTQLPLAAPPGPMVPATAPSKSEPERGWQPRRVDETLATDDEHLADDQRRRPTANQVILAFVGSAVLVLLLLVGFDTWRDGRPAAVAPLVGDGDEKAAGIREESAVESPNRQTADADQSRLETQEKSGDESPHSKDDDEPATPTAATPRDKWDAVCDPLREAVFLLVVEEPKTQPQWPFATATAIGGDTLLTGATVAVELARFRQRGWKLWAINQVSATRMEIADERVHAGFERAGGKPDRQIYADLGLLTLTGNHPHTAPLATGADLDELDELDRGQPVACLAIVHDGEPINRFQSYRPEVTRGKVFAITSLPPSPGGPLLLHVRMTLAAKVYGAPVVNEAGRVLGVFAESAPPPADKPAAKSDLHYVPVVDPALVRAWLERHDEALWVHPTVPPEPTAETKPAP